MLKKPEIKLLKQLRAAGSKELVPYTHPNPLVRWLFWKRLDAALHVSGDAKKVLDFGCGSGIFLPTLYNTFKDVHGLDLDTSGSMRMVERMRLDVKLTEASGTNSNYKSNTFERVFAMDVLEHFQDVGEPLREIRRILKDDGCLIASGPTENLFYEIGRIFFGYKKPEDHYHSIDTIMSLVTQDFVIERVVRLPFGFPTPFSLFKVFIARPKQI